MTNRRINLDNIATSDIIGFNTLSNLINQLGGTKTSTYPPHNIRKLDDSNYVLEMAIAGFKRDEIEITVMDSKLTISGKKVTEVQNYIHHGIASRAFTNTFPLHENIEVQGANLEDGILTVTMKLLVSEEKKPKKIEINQGPQFLTEAK
jgi:molecular chaperone IbpA